MEGPAHVHSTVLLDDLRRSLAGFAEAAKAAMSDADGEIQRTIGWLETEQASYWAGQIHKRQDQLARAQNELRKKSLYKTAGGATPSAVDEHRAVALAKRRLDEAQQKVIAVRQWRRRLEQEVLMYRGQVQAVARLVESDVPRAVALLDRLAIALERYLQAAAPSAGAGAIPDAGSAMRGEETASMARPEAETPESSDDDAGHRQAEEEERE